MRAAAEAARLPVEEARPTEVEDFPAAAMLPEEAAVIGSEARETCEAPSRIEVVSVYVRREAYMAPGLRS